MKVEKTKLGGFRWRVARTVGLCLKMKQRPSAASDLRKHLAQEIKLILSQECQFVLGERLTTLGLCTPHAVSQHNYTDLVCAAGDIRVSPG